MKVILLGPPGAGKGTQATGIADRYKIPHISTGDIFRYHIKNETELGLKVKSYLDKGQLVPDLLTVDIVKNRLMEDDAKDGYLLDGFPRTIVQAEALDEFLADNKNLKVVNIDVPADVLVKRLSGRRVCSKCSATYHIDHNPTKEDDVCDKCGGEVIQRIDDSEETVKDRISVYEKETAPLIKYYEKQNNLFTVDGTQSIETIGEEIFKGLSK